MSSPPLSPAVVVKIGGALVGDAEALTPLWEGIRRLRPASPVVVVHGGGPQATEMARRLGHEPRIVHGRRVTSDLDLSIMQWTLRGALNSSLAAQAHRHGLPAAGICGADGGTLRVNRRPPWSVDGETVDFGHVGDVARIETGLLRTLLAGGFIPILAPLGVDDDGRLYNVNADTVACAVAAALEAGTFLLVTEAGGVRRDPHDPESRLDALHAADIEGGIRDGWIRDGMRVKLSVARDALRAGIPDVRVVAPADLSADQGGTRIFP